MLLTESQLQEIRQIVADHHSAFIINTIGPKAVNPDILAKLKRKGLVGAQVNSIQDAYLYGHVLAALNDPKTANMSLQEFRNYVAKHPVPLSAPEQQAVKMAQQQAAQYVVGLGNRVSAQTGQILIEADDNLRRQMRDTIRDKTARNIAARETVKQLKSDLGHATGDWSRDLDRIAVTEKHDAMEQGTADEYAKEGADTEVGKRPSPSCCDACRDMYLGSDGNPRTFKLSELEANGSNVGRKRADWLPVIGTTHPFCQCKLFKKPKGWGYDKDGVLVPGGGLTASMPWAGTLRKAGSRVEFQGLSIVVEYPANTLRVWDSGRTARMLFSYGYIEGSHGNDGDEMDCLLGPDDTADTAYFVHQLRVTSNTYDEDKVMLGFTSLADAVAAYSAQYDDPRMFGGISPVPVGQLRQMVQASQHGQVAKARTILTVRAPSRLRSKNGPVVSDLVKASGGGSVVTPTVAAAGSLTSRRNIRSRGADGVNFVVSSPVRADKNQKPALNASPLSARRLIPETTGQVAEPPEIVKERYDPGEPCPVAPHPIVLPPQSRADPETQIIDAEANKRTLETHYLDTKGLLNTQPEAKKRRRPVLRGADS